jgi:DUF4097 and DUF4098 domain-containing protein YvlB
MITRILLCTLLTGSTATLTAQRHHEEILVDSQSLATADIRSVEADTEGGNISVEGVQDKEARVEVYAWSRGNEASIRERFTNYYTVKINTSNGKLTVSAKRKRSLKRDEQVSVSFRLYVPVTASSNLNTSGGNIHCRHLTAGRQQVITSGGNIAFDEVQGHVSGKTSGGNISITHCTDTFELFSSGGNVHASQCKGEISLSTSGGNIALDELSGTIKATTSGGNVSANRVNGSLITSSSGGNLQLDELSCSLDASTIGGNLNVLIRKTGEYVKLRNRGIGHTILELPAGSGINLHATGREVKVPSSTNFTGDISEREVKGSANGGGIPVTIDGGDSRVVVTIR